MVLLISEKVDVKGGSEIKRIIDFFNEILIPKLDKPTRSPWIRGLYRSKLKLLPMVFVGSGVSVYMVLHSYFNILPDLTSFRTYTSGLISLFMVYMVPYYVLTNKGLPEHRQIAGFTGISMYMIFSNTMLTDNGYTFDISNFGTDGMLVAVLAGLYTSLIFILFSKKIFFKKLLHKIPKIYQIPLISVFPILVSIFIPWFVVIILRINVFQLIISLLAPLTTIAQTPFGFVILVFLPVVLYSMGISGWILKPLIGPIVTNAIAMNIAGNASNIFTNETLFAYINLGGVGATLGLVLLMMRSKSKKLRAFGFTSAVPALLNIGEPVTYGLVVWNPTLMIPMWINAILLPIITYIFLKIGLAPIPIVRMTQTFIPIGFSAVIVTKSLMSLLLVGINLCVSTFIWYPFFKSTEQKILAANDELLSVEPETMQTNEMKSLLEEAKLTKDETKK